MRLPKKFTIVTAEGDSVSLRPPITLPTTRVRHPNIIFEDLDYVTLVKKIEKSEGEELVDGMCPQCLDSAKEEYVWGGKPDVSDRESDWESDSSESDSGESEEEEGNPAIGEKRKCRWAGSVRKGWSARGGCTVCGVPSRGPRPSKQQQVRTSQLRNPHYMADKELYQVTVQNY